MPSFHATCGPDHYTTHGRCGPDLGQHKVAIWVCTRLSMPCKKNKIQTFINLVIAENPSEYLVKMTKDPENIPKHTIMQIQCQVKVPYM